MPVFRTEKDRADYFERRYHEMVNEVAEVKRSKEKVLSKAADGVTTALKEVAKVKEEAAEVRAAREAQIDALEGENENLREAINLSDHSIYKLDLQIQAIYDRDLIQRIRNIRV